MNKKQQYGFSLIEILIVVAIAATVIIVVGNFSTNISGLNVLVDSQLQAKSDVQQSLEMMDQEIQSATISANGAYPIDSAGTSSFAFYDDITKTGSVDHVRYFYTSSTIYRGIIAPTGTPASYPTSSEIVTDFVDGVTITTSTPLFSYYDSSYTGTQSSMSYPLTLANIRLVGISFSVDLNATSTQPSPAQPFSSLVDMRNLDSN